MMGEVSALAIHLILNFIMRDNIFSGSPSISVWFLSSWRCFYMRCNYVCISFVTQFYVVAFCVRAELVLRIFVNDQFTCFDESLTLVFTIQLIAISVAAFSLSFLKLGCLWSGKCFRVQQYRKTTGRKCTHQYFKLAKVYPADS